MAAWCHLTFLEKVKIDAIAIALPTTKREDNLGLIGYKLKYDDAANIMVKNIKELLTIVLFNFTYKSFMFSSFVWREKIPINPNA